MTEGTVGTGNAYCDRLQTLRVPRVEEFVGRRILLVTATLFDLMIVALLENGGPMSLEAVAERLEKAGGPARGIISAPRRRPKRGGEIDREERRARTCRLAQIFSLRYV